MMRLLRGLAFGVLIALGAYCVGFVAWRIAAELYPWAGAVMWVLFLGWMAICTALGSFYGFFARDAQLRSLVLATVIVVTLTSFYALAIRVVDEQHNLAAQEQSDRWSHWVKIIQRQHADEELCQSVLLDQRIEQKGYLDSSDTAVSSVYCDTWGRNAELVDYPIDEFWTAYDKQGGYPERKENDDA